MYLSRLVLNRSRLATLWVSNPYRVHQRLKMACGDDPRLLFRIEFGDRRTQILAQTLNEPDWTAAFSDFAVLAEPAEHKDFSPSLAQGGLYRFRLLANPTVKKTIREDGAIHKTRLGIWKSNDQAQWLRRKLLAAGAELLDYRIVAQGLIHSRKNPAKDERGQTHYAVLFEGILKITDVALASDALKRGMGSGKAYGFGLLSLASLKP